MIELHNKFKLNLETNITSVSSFINIFPDVKPEEYQDVYNFIISTSETSNTPIAQFLVDKYGSKENYMKAIHKYSSKDMSIRYGPSTKTYSFDALLTKHPKVRNSLDMKTKLSKVSNLSLGLYTQRNGYKKLEGIEKCYNSAVAVYYRAEGCNNITQCALVFVGGISEIKQNKDSMTLACNHVSNIYNDIELPTNDIPYQEVLPDKYKQKPYPMVYGEVDGAHASLSKIDLDSQQEYKHIVFDNPNANCEGFIDTDMPQAQPSNTIDVCYDTDKSQMYVADGQNLCTILRRNHFWFWGDPNAYDYTDIQNGYSWRYHFTDQYTYGTPNGIRAYSFVGENPRRVNPIKNNAVVVQFKDTFDGITMNNHEEGDNVPNGFDISYANSGQQDDDLLGNVTNITGDEDSGVYWVNNCDLQNANEFFNKGDYRNRNAFLKFRFWTTFTDMSPTQNYPNGNDAIETFRGMRCQFLSKASSINSYRHFFALHFKSRLKVSQYKATIRTNGVAESELDLLSAWTPPDGNNASMFSYPFGAATTGMYWLAGTFQMPQTADFDGTIPQFYPALEQFGVPIVCATRHFPVRYRGYVDNYGDASVNEGLGTSQNMGGLLNSPVTESGQVLFDTWNINSDDINRNNNNYEFNSDNFYLQNRKPYESNARHIYDWWTAHSWKNTVYPYMPWWSPVYNKRSKDLAEHDLRSGDAGVGSIINDGLSYKPRTYSYADSTDTTLMMLPPQLFNLGWSSNINNNPTNELVYHAYNELEIYDVYADRIYMKEDFLESDFFAKVRGRRGYTEINGPLSNTAVHKPNEIIYHILSDELKFGKKIIIDDDAFQNASQQNIKINTAFSINQKTPTKKILENITKESKIYLKNNTGGTITIDSMKEHYSDEDVDLTILSDDVVKYKFSNTKLSDIKNQVKINFNKKYAGNIFENTSGFYTDPDTGEDLYSIFIDGILQRSTFFNGYQGEIFNYDEFSYQMYNNLNTSALSELNDENKIYSLDYYNLKNTETKLEVECETIRDFISASELQKYLILWNCNQHLMVDLDLPLRYAGLEVGDIVNFDKLIKNQTAFNFDYTKRYVKNGQVIYPYFIVTKTDKSVNNIKVTLTQLHRLDWGLDGHSMNIDSDNTYNSNKEPALYGQDDPLTNVEFTPSALYFGEYEGEIHTIYFYNAFAEISNIDISSIDFIEEHQLVSDPTTGFHSISYRSNTTNTDEETKTGNIIVNFEGSTQDFVFNVSQEPDSHLFANNVTFYFVNNQELIDNTINELYSLGETSIVQNNNDLIQRVDIKNNVGGDDSLFDILTIQCADNQFFDLRNAWSGLGSGDNEDAFTDNLRMADGGSYLNGGSNLGNGFPPDWCFIHYITEPETISYPDGDITYQYIEVVVFNRDIYDEVGEQGTVLVNSGNYETEYYNLGEYESDDYAGVRSAHLFFEASLNPDTPNQGPTNGIALDIVQEGMPFVPPIIEGGQGDGDVNGDGVCNILDVVGMINAILVNMTDDAFFHADINDDGIVNIQDVIILISHILEAPLGQGSLIPDNYYVTEEEV